MHGFSAAFACIPGRGGSDATPGVAVSNAPPIKG